MQNLTRFTLALGLAILFLAFLLLDREQWQLIPPVGPVSHPFAALLGSGGLLVTWLGARQLRSDVEATHYDEADELSSSS